MEIIDEVHQRYSLFYIVANMGSAFAGILAFGLMQIKELGGLHGWRWIFTMEGIVSLSEITLHIRYKAHLRRLQPSLVSWFGFGLWDYQEMLKPIGNF
jgi:MFS family permease